MPQEDRQVPSASAKMSRSLPYSSTPVYIPRDLTTETQRVDYSLSAN